MGLDESLKLLVIAHEEGRHELARTPSVDVCSGHRRSGAEVFGDLLQVEMFGYVLLPFFVFQSQFDPRISTSPKTFLSCYAAVLGITRDRQAACSCQKHAFVNTNGGGVDVRARCDGDRGGGEAQANAANARLARFQSA